MKFLPYYILSFVFFILTAKDISGQIDEDDKFEHNLLEKAEMENPVYKPVLAFGLGAFNFMGDVNDFYSSVLGAEPGFKFNVSTSIDDRRYYKLNFFLLYGNLSGNERSFMQPERNLNFESEIINFGLSFEYTFKHLINTNLRITPFMSVGAESFQFNSKADLLDSEGNQYNYWSDGTIRNIPESSQYAHESVVTQRDYVYETDLRSANLYGLGNYPQLSFAIPVDYGLDFRISDRVTMRLGSSLHFTFTELIDNVSSQGTGIKGKGKNNRFSYSYVTFHLDLFSDAKTIMIESLNADTDFDYTMVEDNDGDGVFDFWDECPNTPAGVEVDEFGCPVDSDGDGVPDYIDREPNTRPGAFADDLGREISSEQLSQMLEGRDEAVSRNEIKMHNTSSSYNYSGYKYQEYSEIPEKFLFLDMDRDGFISFEELVSAIDMFFDEESDLTLEDIYELNNFFFSQ